MPKHAGSIDQLIINSPFEEPKEHWRYDRATRRFHRDGMRRPAGYLVATPGARGFDDPGTFIELDLVNKIRPLINAWRQENYPGVTGTTRRLLEHWYDSDSRDGRRFFFCQLEAIETIIWLTEAAPKDLNRIDVPGDGGDFTRWCTKLATGTGKTVVMSMLIAWHIMNKAAYPHDQRFSKNVLVISPGLTVRNRLSVLVPDAAGNYYDEFSIVPPSLFEFLRQGRVNVLNWHKLSWESREQIAKRRSVDKRGPKSDEAYAREVLGEMASARDLLVVNDEAHHAWRVPAESKISGVEKDDIEEATVWVGGLDRIHRARRIQHCFDFSATPFVPSSSKTSEETLFSWIVSDFGLNDAIEAGLVKTPRVVVRDDGKMASDFKSRFYHIYNDPEVKDDLNRKAQAHEPLPDLVTNAYYLLGKDWLETAQQWKAANALTPPVMITVANNTETAARIKYAFDHGKVLIDELRAPERTLHIDSNVLKQAESQDEPIPILPAAESDDDDDEEDGDQPVQKLTKQEKAELLRRMVDTVGQPGQSGGQIQNVISVRMLSEGWDAKTVTHIMGLRAFSSQLLCEQVVGRGLRRTSYELNPETGLFDPEYVNIFGVPFSFLPYEGNEDAAPPPPLPKTRVEPIAKRELDYSISWPNVIRIEHVYRPQLRFDIASVPILELDSQDTSTYAELAAVLEGKTHLSSLTEIDLQELGRKFRMQKIVFETARDVHDQMKPSWRGNTDILLQQVIRIVEQFLRSDRIRIKPELFNNDPIRRRVILTLNMNKIVRHLWNSIRHENTVKLEPVFDRQKPVLSTGDARIWYTGKPCAPTERSHINFCVFDSTWEATASNYLDRERDLVSSWVKNDHLGFDILYIYQGRVRRYRPDFLIRLANNKHLVLEVKGQPTDEDEVKWSHLGEWVDAINSYGGFGQWAWDVSYEPNDLGTLLQKHAA